MSLSFLLLLLGGFTLFPVPGEAFVYYATPTEPPNSGCPGEPCQTLDYYFSHGDRYFSSDKINVTMILLHGKHTLSNGHGCESNDNYYFVQDLETFEVIGMEPCCVPTGICLENVTVSYIGTLTFVKAGPCAAFSISDKPTNSKQSSTSEMDQTMFITINGTRFNGVVLSSILNNVVIFNIVVVNSTFYKSVLPSFSFIEPKRSVLHEALENYEMYCRKVRVCSRIRSCKYHNR